MSVLSGSLRLTKGGAYCRCVSARRAGLLTEPCGFQAAPLPHLASGSGNFCDSNFKGALSGCCPRNSQTKSLGGMWEMVVTGFNVGHYKYAISYGSWGYWRRGRRIPGRKIQSHPGSLRPPRRSLLLLQLKGLGLQPGSGSNVSFRNKICRSGYVYHGGLDRSRVPQGAVHGSRDKGRRVALGSRSSPRNRTSKVFCRTRSCWVVGYSRKLAHRLKCSSL